MAARQKTAEDRELVLLEGGLPDHPGLHVTFLGGAKRDLRWMPFSDAAEEIDFAKALPVREFPAYREQRNFPGQYWSATTGDFLYYESWLERDSLMLLDFDDDIVGLATQPFWLHGTRAGKRWSHCPDIAVRHRDGSLGIVDVKPTARLEKFEERAGWTRAACEQVGWRFSIVSEPEPVLLNNVAWLAGYRRRFVDGGFADALIEACREPRPFWEAVEQVGDPIFVKPVAYQLLWRRALEMRLDRALLESHLIGVKGWLSS